MKNILFILLALVSTNLFSQKVNAQVNPDIEEDVSIPKIRTCASADYLHEMELDPVVKVQRTLIEQQTQAFIANPTGHKSRLVIKIPVVVHVLYNLSTQNISDAQINSQIAILNKDFRKLNVEIPTIPAAFGPLAADCEIEFALAHTSPTGDSTTGITRTFTTKTSFTSNNNVKYTALGGKDAWSRDQYLNIWICKLSGSLLGYAQFPGGAAATDGVVISFKAFGNTGVVSPPYNKGRTATHEIGHWLNIFHIWGDDGGACSGTDLVSDTPNQGSENYGSPTYPRYSCGNTTTGDMFMNYMDYTNDAAMSMFSTGQKQRMQSLFVTGGARKLISTSTKYNYPAPTIACGAPTNLLKSNITAEEATITWNPVAGATSYNLKYWPLSYSNYPLLTSTTTNSKMLTQLYSQMPYKVTVQAVCPLGNSVLIIDSFTTLEAIVYFRCANTNTEPNNYFSEAFNLTSNAALESTIQVSNDNDFYHVTTTDENPNLLITLEDIPMDYDLNVYNSKKELIATSRNSGNAIEEVSYNATKGDSYFVEVYGYNGCFSNNACYHLTSKISNTEFYTASINKLNTKPEIYFYPNPAVEQIAIELYADGEHEIVYNLYNTMGQLVKSKVATAHEGQNKILIDVNTLANGLYILEYRSGMERKIQKLNIKK